YSPQYQWYRGTVALRDDGRITGTTTSELTIRNVRQGDIGEDYYCVVTGLCGSQTSQVGGLYVGQVEIVRGPQDVRVCEGQEAVLSVQVSSNIPDAVYSYRWYKDGQVLEDGGVYSGTGTSVLRIVGARQAESGQYTVEVVASPGGAVASASAQVVVDRVPVISVEPE
ncbi:MAG: immunoglobulin domain-containing protein, partial [Candidatus Kapabacteria bacterium]|nr:immunoglobulin domain-containing protein [Candidatus Kapabacteria bacterium]